MVQDQSKYTSKLAGTNILIIGGTSGLGFGVAEALLEQYPPPANIILSSSNASRVDEAVKRLKKSYPNATKTTVLTGLTCNLADEDNLEANIVKLFESLPLKNGEKLAHVVHTAGDALAVNKLADLTYPKIRQAGMVRFFAPLLIAKHAVAYLPSTPESSITVTGGGIADQPREGWAAIAGYAAGLQGMTRGLAIDLKPVRVNLVQPGAVDTELWGDKENREKIQQAFLPKLATGKVGAVEDVVEGFLMCLKDTNVTASVIRSDGGHAIM